ncbi:putative neutral amino acid transporter, partial [Candida maltosa Xu316]
MSDRDHKLDLEQIDEHSVDTDEYLQKEIEEENQHDINYRNCSWQKTAGLLF